MTLRLWKTSLSSISEPIAVNLLAETRRLRLEKVLQAASHDFDLRFEFGQRDSLGKSTVIMRAEAGEVASAQYLILKGRALHLLGHFLTDSQPWLEAARREDRDRPRFSAFWHALEDARQENSLINRWPGAARALNANVLPNLGGRLVATMSIPEQLEMGLYFEGRGLRGARFRARVREVLEDLQQDILHAAHSHTPQDTFSAMLQIYPVLQPMLHLMPGKPHHRRDKEPSPEPVDGQEGSPQEFIELPSEIPPPPGVPGFQESEDLVTVGVLGRRLEFPEWFRPGSAPWFERGSGGKAIHPTALRSSSETIVEPPRGEAAAYRLLRSEIQREAGFLAQRLTNLIRDEVYLRYGGYFRSGKLNMAKLWKQRIGSYRLFQRPISGGNRALAFSLLVDESASMKGQDKISVATKAAVVLGETLEMLDVPLEIIGFSTTDFEARAALRLGLTPAHKYRYMRCSALEHRIYKRFSEPYTTARLRLTGIQPRCNNWDEEHLLFAFQRLQERQESRKLIIVISDGQPNGDANTLIHTVERIERMGVKVIGIGIGADFVRQIYPHAIVVSDFRQMAEELLHILEREFLNGANLSA
jgi:hypothetical protein